MNGNNPAGQAIQWGGLVYLVPGPELEQQAVRLKQEFLENGEGTIDGSCNWGAIASFPVWLQHCRQVNSGQQPQRVASSTYFVQSPALGALVGMVDIRHSLNKAQYPYGHIGYSVIPSQRGKGFATQILAFALARAGELGVQSPLLCCYESNLASRRVMEKNGLRQVGRNAEKSTGRMVLMYTKG